MTRRPTLLAGAIGTALFAGAVGTPGTAGAAHPANQQASLDSARQILLTAQKRLVQARAEAAAVQIDAIDGVVGPDAVAAVTDTGLSSGSSDLELIATLMNPGDPQGVLGTATIEQLGSVENLSDDSKPTIPVVHTAQQATALAKRKVALAERRLVGAQALVKQITRPGTADGPGAAKLARLCAEAGVVIEQCEPVRWDEGHLQFDTVMIGRTVNITWPAVKLVGGWRPSDPYPDHPSGRAADIMMPNGGQGSDVALGNAIAKYFQQHAEEYGIEYMIWRQRQWQAGDPVGAWNGMSDRGSATANHFDHVHITVTDGHSGTVFRDLIKEARAAGLGA